MDDRIMLVDEASRVSPLCASCSSDDSTQLIFCDSCERDRPLCDDCWIDCSNHISDNHFCDALLCNDCWNLTACVRCAMPLCQGCAEDDTDKGRLCDYCLNQDVGSVSSGLERMRM